MHPVRTNETNFTYLGPTFEVADLPCRREGLDTYSVWMLTDEERDAIAAGGHIRLGIHGVAPIPPVSLQVVPDDGPTHCLATLCDVCGRHAGDAIHQGLAGHAFRDRRGATENPRAEAQGSKYPDEA